MIKIATYRIANGSNVTRKSRDQEAKLKREEAKSRTLLAALSVEVNDSEVALEAALASRSEVPQRIRLGDCENRGSIKLSYEGKLLMDTIKLCAYGVETMLFNLIRNCSAFCAFSREAAAAYSCGRKPAEHGKNHE